MYVKDWFKPNCPLFLTLLLDLISNTHVDFASHSPILLAIMPVDE
jgi:hypothetical protein